jgi:phage-related protein
MVKPDRRVLCLIRKNVVFSDYFIYIYTMIKKRELIFYKNYFRDFYKLQTKKVQTKIIWTLKIIEDLDRIPEIYFKHLENTNGLYEIRIQSGNNIYRIFCFFDDQNIVVVGHGFQKKSQKIPLKEIGKAQKIRKEYFDEKE